MLTKKYIILKTLGRGSFAKVKLAVHNQSKEKIALKVISKESLKTDEDRERVKREIIIGLKARHPCIAQMFENVETSKYHFLLLEYGQNGDLAEYIDRNRA